MAQKITPMRKQYLEMKEKCPDCLLFFRLGDFYEMFDEDARIASKVLDLTLTTRDRNKDIPQEEKVPMCGVPYHSYQSYLARLVAKGYKVAICEQTQDPAAATGIVLLGGVSGVAGHEPHQKVAGNVVDLCQQVGKVHVAVQILAVAVHVLSQQGDVLVPLSHQAADFF